jgi:hypothetical protein
VRQLSGVSVERGINNSNKALRQRTSSHTNIKLHIATSTTKTKTNNKPQQRDLNSLLIMGISTIGVVFLVVNVLLFIIDNSAASSSSRKSALLEPQRLISIGGLELDAYGRPSESQLRREVLRIMRPVVSSSPDSDSDRAAAAQLDEDEKHALLNVNVALGSRKLKAETGTGIKSTTTTIHGDALADVTVKGAPLIHIHNNAKKSKQEEQTNDNGAAAATSPPATATPIIAGAGASVTSPPPSQFADVDEAVRSLTLKLDLSRSRRISNRIGCHWVTAQEADTLEDRPRPKPTRPHNKSKAKNANLDQKTAIALKGVGSSLAQKAKRKVKRMLRGGRPHADADDQHHQSSSHNTRNRHSNKSTTKKNDKKVSSGPKPDIILHREDGEIKAWGQEDR